MPKPRPVIQPWDEATARRLDPVGRLVYRSNLLGSDQRLTNTGGGNTSAKLTATDPVTGKRVEVLWVKGSGGDLRTVGRDGFASLDLRQLRDLRREYAARRDKGLKSRAEDAMVARYAAAAFGGNPRAASIDTPLHAFLPGRQVDHLHPNAIIAIAASAGSRRLTREVFGETMAYVPWMRPGFELGLAMERIARRQPRVRAILMGRHGFIAWQDGDRACYEATLRFVRRAEAFIARRDAANGGDATAFGGPRLAALAPGRRRAALVALLPWLRRRVAARGRAIATVQHDARTLRFVNSRDARRLAALGTSCPDHFLRTKIEPLFVDWNPHGETVADLRRKLAAGLQTYRRNYAAYYRKFRRKDSPPMRDANPTVILIPGLGLIAWGRDKAESRVTAEFYGCAIDVMRGAEAIDRYVALPRREAFDIEYWALEEAKLRRMPPEKSLARRVEIVVGAGSRAGRKLALDLAERGAQVVCLDADGAAARATARAITTAVGRGIGVAGTGVSAAGPAFGRALRIGDPKRARRALQDAILAYGGFDRIHVAPGVEPAFLRLVLSARR
jgi:rhamnulose-1-phosphate aldolase/alcohol dehydrogenase